MIIIAAAIPAYLLVMFVLSRLIVPRLGLWKAKLPEKIPESMEAAIRALKRKSKGKEEFLKNAYNFLAARNPGMEFGGLLHFNMLFWTDLERLWAVKGYLPCHATSHIMRIFLVRSGFFSDDEIKVRHTFIDFAIHQYLKVRLGSRGVDVDVWAAHLGIPLGRHAWLLV